MGRTIGSTWSAAAVTSSRTDPERGMTMLRNVDWTRSPEGPRSVLTVLLALSGLVYFGVVTLTSVLAPYRFAIPYAVPIFDTPFVLAAIGVGYLCWERHRVRQDVRSASLGGALWLAGLLGVARSEEHTSELQSRSDLVCRLLLEKKKNQVQVCPAYTARTRP